VNADSMQKSGKIHKSRRMGFPSKGWSRRR
jgi:hypothetical protein